MKIQDFYDVKSQFLPCTNLDATFDYGEIDWLIKRNREHYLFLTCFWGTLILGFIISIFGRILEFMFKPNMQCCGKIVRFLRSTLYKTSMSIPIMVLFAFDYTKRCLELRNTTFMVFSNAFAYITLAILFPVLLIVSLDVIYEFYIWKPNATYSLVKVSIEGQPICTKIRWNLVYLVLFVIIIIVISIFDSV